MGNIVFINSNTAYRAISDRVAYVASKGGQLGLMRALKHSIEGDYNRVSVAEVERERDN